MTTNGHVPQSEWIRAAVDRYEGHLTRYAYRITRNLGRAQEVVQETFLRLCRETSGELDGRLGEWLFTVCRNQAFDVYRKERRMTTFTAEQAEAVFADQALEPAARVDTSDEASRIQFFVDQLPGSQQEVIRLKFQNGLSYQEISKVTGHSVSNVGFLIHRGLKTVRERMNPPAIGDEATRRATNASHS